MLTVPISSAPVPESGSPAPVADRLEQAFLEEMRKYAGPKPAQDAFGTSGESPFSTFLTREYAALLSESLDFGLHLKGADPR